jgi:predicted lipoprotein with Yx(FWY)xxD motif
MRRTRDLARGAAFAGLLAIALAACSGYQAPGSDNGKQAQQQPQQAQQPQQQPSTPAQADAAVIKLVNSRFGPILADAGGRTLYGFTKDVKGSGRSNCNGQCIATWPALTASGTPLAGAGVQAAMLGTIQRDDGTSQVTYGDWPLYFYGGDVQAGQTNGQNVNGIWFVVSAQGKLVKAASAGAGSSGGASSGASNGSSSNGSSGGGYGSSGGYGDSYGG